MPGEEGGQCDGPAMRYRKDRETIFVGDGVWAGLLSCWAELKEKEL